MKQTIIDIEYATHEDMSHNVRKALYARRYRTLNALFDQATIALNIAIVTIAAIAAIALIVTH